jgi:hypothetical protein
MSEKELEKVRLAYRTVFGGDSGKIVLESLAKFCNMDNTSVCEQKPDALQTFFNEGKRRVFLRIKWYLENKEDE